MAFVLKSNLKNGGVHIYLYIYMQTHIHTHNTASGTLIRWKNSNQNKNQSSLKPLPICLQIFTNIFLKKERYQDIGSTIVLYVGKKEFLRERRTVTNWANKKS